MSDREISAFTMLVLLVLLLPIFPSRAAAQEELKPIDPNDARLTFSFPIQRGGKPFDFKVELDKTGAIAAVSVHRKGASDQLQRLPECDGSPDQVTKAWDDHDISLLIAHADLNFDGFEDLELLQNYIPHLDKKLYCVYLWNNETGRFSYSKELSEIAANLEVHPENKTLTNSDEWQGGAWQETTYRWNGSKLEPVEQTSLLGDWSVKTKTECGFTYTCRRLVRGKLVTTLEKSICTPDEMDQLPDCPGTDVPRAPKPPPPEPHAIPSH